jgi:hypothetical protein
MTKLSILLIAAVLACPTFATEAKAPVKAAPAPLFMIAQNTSTDTTTTETTVPAQKAKKAKKTKTTSTTSPP